MEQRSKSQKGGEILFYDGYRYRVDRVNEYSTSWRCTYRGCRGRLVSSGSAKNITTEHNHAPNPAQIEVDGAKESIKSMARSTYLQPRFIVQASTSSLSEEAAVQMTQYEASRKAIQRVRHGTTVAMSKFNSASEVQLGEEFTTTEKGESFLLWDSGSVDNQRILLFATRANMDTMCEFRHWAIDGTFKVCPPLFEQLFTVHALIDGKAVPMVYALLTNKRQDTYRKLFQAMKNLQPLLNPQSVLVDFELASINAVKLVFPETTIVGCSFHLGQSLWRKIQEAKLTQLYRTNETFRLNCKMLLGLSYVPERDVQFALEVVSESFSPEMKPLVEYWESTYVGRRIHNLRPRFDISIWNMFERLATDLPKSNNSVEAWHNAFAKTIQCHHPHLARFVTHLKKEQSTSEQYITRYRSGFRKEEYNNSKYVQLRNRLRVLTAEYSFANVEQHLRGAARNSTL